MPEKSFKRKLTTMFSADVAEYSRLMSQDEAATVKTLKAYRGIMAELIKQHRGRVVDSPGDNVLAEFTSVVDAVQCAVSVQKELQARNAELPEDRRMEFRIGVNLGDVIEEEDRIYGDGVNIAARLEALADPGGICISKTAFDQIETKLPLGYEYLGEQTVKNIAKPVGAYRLLMEPRVTVAEVGEEKKAWPLRRMAVFAAACAVVAVAIAAVIWNFYFRPPAMDVASVEKMAFPLPEKPSIAVLPFENLSGDPDQEYIADGITENIITGLSQISEMFVIARNSVFTYKGKPVKIQEVSEELGVRYVLEGSVQRAGDRLRITAQLIDALKGHHLWTERYDRDLKDIFALQDEITMKIIRALGVKLPLWEVAQAFETDNFEVWSHVVRGAGLLRNYIKEDSAKARKLFEQAVKLDPDYAMAWVQLGWAHVQEAQMGWGESPAKSIKRAFELAQKASALAETQPDVHILLLWIYLIQNQHDEAIAEGERAIALGPNDAEAHHQLAMIMRRVGRFEEAIALSKKAMRLEPYYASTYAYNLGASYYHVGKYEEAVALTKQYLQLAESRGEGKVHEWLHLVLAISYVRLGQEEEARAHAEELLRAFPYYSIEVDRKSSFYRDPVHLEPIHDDLRKAGIPEK